jgi:pilus assembly protein Flp/PilA
VGVLFDVVFVHETRGGKNEAKYLKKQAGRTPETRTSHQGVKAMLTYARSLIRQLVRDEKGATAIEYGLIAALIAVAAVTVMGTVGTNLTSTFTTVAGKL